MRRVAVAGFWIDRTPVTTRAFAAFVAATGHVTLAERSPPDGAYPGADPALLVPGSMVFAPPDAPCDAHDWRGWWGFTQGASWRRPIGPGGPDAIDDHPVVHVGHEDAAAYAAWAGKALPTEAEWEYAARGGLEGAEFAWGDELAPGGVHRANTWQGRFPAENLAEDGFTGLSPVEAFPPNGFGLSDMIGNVWEWTADAWTDDHAGPAPAACCGGAPRAVGAPFPRKVVKGGSHLCAPNYCRRYRPAARQPQSIDTTTGHIGFRCVRRPSAEDTRP